MAVARLGPTADSGLLKVALFAAVVLLAGAACFAGLSMETGSQLQVVLPLAGVVGLGLAVLAVKNFTVFLLVILVARASLDLTKVSPGLGAQAADPATRALDPASMLGLLFLLMASLWLVAQHRSNQLVSGSLLRSALIAFVATGFLSVLGSTETRLPSLLEAVRILSAVVMFIVLEQMMAKKENMRRLLMGVYLSTLFPLIVTTAGFIGSGPRQEVKGEFSRVVGPFAQSNTFGRYLMLILIFGVAIYPYLERGYRRLFAFILPASAYFLVLTLTRSALIAAVLGFVVVAIAQGKPLLVGVIILGAASLLFVPQIGARFGVLSEQDPAAAAAPNSVDWRVDHWTSVLPLFGSSPITGIGWSNIARLSDNEAQSHNDFVRALVETGVFGFLTYLAVLTAIIVVGRRSLAAAPQATLERGVAAGFLGCGVAFISASVVANIISNVVTMWYFFAFAAAASSVARRHKGHTSDPEAPQGIARLPVGSRE